jgi:hypothetical protein
MATGLLTDHLIARCMAKELGDRLEDDTPPFRCHIGFEMTGLARTMRLEDFWDWHVRPNVVAALCYAENGAGEALAMPPNVQGGIYRYRNAEVRYLHMWDIKADQMRHRLDMRYPA